MSCEKENLHSLPPEELGVYLKLHRGLTEANRFRNVTGFFLGGSLIANGILEQDHHFDQAEKLEKALEEKLAETVESDI